MKLHNRRITKITLPACTKVDFDTKPDAELRAKAINDYNYKHNNQSDKSLRAYLCNRCNKYHLTSMSKPTHKKVLKIKQKRRQFRIEQEANYWAQKLGIVAI